MNLQQIKKIANIERLDVARVILNDCFTLDDVVEQINAVKREHFATTLAAVYCFDCILAELGEETVLAEVTSVNAVKASMDAHWDCLVEAGAKTLPGGYHHTASKLWALIKYLRAENGIPPPKEIAEHIPADEEAQPAAEALGHKYTEAELLKLGRQSKTKRWAVSIFTEDKHTYTSKWYPSARGAKAEALRYLEERNLAPGEYSAWLSNQADYNEEIELVEQGAKE